MRLAVLAAAAALAAVPARPLAQGRSEATPAPKADAGPSAPPKAEEAPPAGNGATAQPAPKAEVAPKSAQPSKPPPAAARDLAKALLSEEQWSKVLDSYSSSLASQISQSLLSSGEKVPDDLRGTLRSELGKALPYQQTVQAQAEALSKELTADELKRTAQFYASPLGRKVLERLPEAQASVAQQLQGRLATAVPEIVNRVAPKAMSGGSHGSGTGSGSSHGSGTGSGAPVQERRSPDQGATH